MPKCIIISSVHYLCLLNECSDITTIKVLAVQIPHAEGTTLHFHYSRWCGNHLRCQLIHLSVDNDGYELSCPRAR